MRLRASVPYRFRAWLLAGCAIAVTACGPRSVGDVDSDLPDGGRGDGSLTGTDALDAPQDVRYRDVVTYDVYLEDRCPTPPGPAVRMYDCDPFNQTGCAPGEACHPYIDYPDGPCGREVYRSTCVPAGTTPVDGFCTSGFECAPGLTCFVTGAGNRCLRLCRIDGGDPMCPRGQVCEPTDLPDFGACD